MKLSEFLMMCPDVAVNTLNDNTYAIVYESNFGGIGLQVNCNSLDEYVFAVRRMHPATLAKDVTGKTKGKEYNQLYQIYYRIINRMKDLVSEYIEEIKEIAEDIIPSNKN